MYKFVSVIPSFFSTSSSSSSYFFFFMVLMFFVAEMSHTSSTTSLNPSFKPVYHITENCSKNTIIADLKTDLNAEEDSVFDLINKRIKSFDVSSLFTLDRSSGLLYCWKGLDREAFVTSNDIYAFNVTLIVVVTSSDRKRTLRKVVVSIGDQNDNTPSFTDVCLSVLVSQTTPPYTLYRVANITDPDSQWNSIKRCYQTSIHMMFRTYCKYEGNSGWGLYLLTVAPLYDEVKPLYHLRVAVEERNVVVGESEVEDYVDDGVAALDDDLQKMMHDDVKQITDLGSYCENSISVFNEESANHGAMKSNTEPNDKDISTAKKMRSKTKKGLITFFSFTVKVYDAYNPIFTPDSVRLLELSETTVVGNVVGKVTAKGINGEVEYRMDKEDVFKIDRNIGYIKLVKKLDYNKAKRYDLKVYAEDLKDKRFQSVKDLIVLVLDFNEHSPVIKISSFSGSKKPQIIKKNKTPKSLKNIMLRKFFDETLEQHEQMVVYVEVNDEDDDGAYVECNVSDERFSLQRLYLNNFILKTNFSFDRQMELRVNITCKDHGFPSLGSNEEITIEVIDEKMIKLTNSCQEIIVKKLLKPGTELCTIKSLDSKPSLKFFISNSTVLRIDRNTGIVSVGESLKVQKESIQRVYVEVVDSESFVSATTNIDVYIVDATNVTASKLHDSFPIQDFYLIFFILLSVVAFLIVSTAIFLLTKSLMKQKKKLSKPDVIDNKSTLIDHEKLTKPPTEHHPNKNTAFTNEPSCFYFIRPAYHSPTNVHSNHRFHNSHHCSKKRSQTPHSTHSSYHLNCSNNQSTYPYNRQTYLSNQQIPFHDQTIHPFSHYTKPNHPFIHPSYRPVTHPGKHGRSFDWNMQ